MRLLEKPALTPMARVLDHRVINPAARLIQLYRCLRKAPRHGRDDTIMTIIVRGRSRSCEMRTDFEMTPMIILRNDHWAFAARRTPSAYWPIGLGTGLAEGARSEVLDTQVSCRIMGVQNFTWQGFTYTGKSGSCSEFVSFSASVTAKKYDISRLARLRLRNRPSS